MADEQTVQEQPSKPEAPHGVQEQKPEETDWKAEARKWESRAKPNKTAADELDHITKPAYAEPCRADRHAVRNNTIAALFVRHGIMRTLVEHFALGGQAVFTPLLFDVDQRPLPRAKAIVLDARYGEEVLLAILRYPIISTVTPCGIALLSTSTQ